MFQIVLLFDNFYRFIYRNGLTLRLSMERTEVRTLNTKIINAFFIVA